MNDVTEKKEALKGEVIVPLHKIPEKSKLRVELQGSKKLYPAIFHHVDGMYSYCTLDGVPPGSNSFHLSAATPMKLCEDGVYEIV